MRNRLLFALAVIGLVAGLVSAYLYGIEKKPQPPVFNPASNPYAEGIYTNGVIESYQETGENVNIYPEVPGTVTRVLVAEGDIVGKGTPLLVMDDTSQRALVEQQRSQAEAALTVLEQLRAKPRKEDLDIAEAQVALAIAHLKTSQDQSDKLRRAYELEPRSVSKDTLDNAENAVNAAWANYDVARKQYDLIQAGAWIYDIRNQQKQYDALSQALISSKTLLDKYTLKAPADGVVLSIHATAGSYISPQGAYGTYTQGLGPVIVMGSSAKYLGVRCYIDEILLPRLPQGEQMKARMFIRGSDISIPLEYVRVQPYVSPKIQLSSQRIERVDVRVLPVVFRFEKPEKISLYPGQLVDVYVGEKQAE
jgi:HlyD family secretion protein